MSTGFETPKSLFGWAIWLVIFIAVVAVVFVAANAFGITIPSWVMTCLWICGGAAFFIAVITFLAKLGRGV